jgi:hypothetical protein
LTPDVPFAEADCLNSNSKESGVRAFLAWIEDFEDWTRGNYYNIYSTSNTGPMNTICNKEIIDSDPNEKYLNQCVYPQYYRKMRVQRYL